MIRPSSAPALSRHGIAVGCDQGRDARSKGGENAVVGTCNISADSESWITTPLCAAEMFGQQSRAVDAVQVDVPEWLYDTP